jgi:acetate kinase
VSAEGDRPSGTLVVCCLNCGSSSVKGAVYRLDGRLDGRIDGRIDGRQETRVAEATVDHLDAAAGAAGAVAQVLDRLIADAGEPDAVGHRVVHGGPHLYEPVLVTPEVLEQLRAAEPFAPLHLPAALAAIDAVKTSRPSVPQVACFDTAFHRTMPEAAWRLALPRELAGIGMRRYGFHGLSYEYLVGSVGAEVLGRAVLAHLGSGASMVAVRDGQSVDTTMGMTPTGGLPMGTRSGDLDPGALVHLLRARELDADGLERLLDRESGLRGLSGSTGDMRELLTARTAGDAVAGLAVEVFVTRVRMQIGAYAALLGGLDSVVFAGGIGERAAPVRAEACEGLGHLGIRIDRDRNAAHEAIISVDDSPVTVRVVRTDEDVVIARHVRAVLARAAG